MAAGLRVVHAVLSLDCGGLERVVVDLARIGRKRGQEVSVLCLERPGALCAQAEQAGAHVVCLDKAPGLRWRRAACAQAALEELRPDVLHTHQVGALLHIGRAARRAGIRAIVHTEHGNHIDRARGWRRRLRYRLLLAWASRRCGRICCVSADIARAVTALGLPRRRKVSVVPNGIDCGAFAARSASSETRRELGIPEDAVVVCSVGRLNEIKRYDLLLQALAAVRRYFPTIRVLLVGDGPARAELTGLTTALGLSGCVHFAGYQAEPQRFFRAMDIFALTSRMEGLPLAILEAWAAGLPVIATAVGGVPDLIDHGRNGLLIPSGDVSALVAALEELVADGVHAAALGQEGQTCVRARYSLERMSATYEAHYRELLNATALPQHRVPAAG